MSSDVISRMASDAFSRGNDDKSSSRYPDLGRVLTSRRVINGGKLNILRPVVTWSVSCECDVGRIGALPFSIGAESASRSIILPIVLLESFNCRRSVTPIIADTSVLLSARCIVGGRAVGPQWNVRLKSGCRDSYFLMSADPRSKSQNPKF